MLSTAQSLMKIQTDELINKRCTRPLDYSDSINMCIISTFFYSIFFILSAKSQSFPSYLEDYQEISCTSYLSCGYKTHAQLWPSWWIHALCIINSFDSSKYHYEFVFISSLYATKLAKIHWREFPPHASDFVLSGSRTTFSQRHVKLVSSKLVCCLTSMFIS